MTTTLYQQHRYPQQPADPSPAATIAKLSMKPNGAPPDEDDNQPLGLIKRMKKLDRVQQQAIKPTVLTQNQQQQQQPSRADPITRPRPSQLDTTHGANQTRKHSDHLLTPLSPSLQDHTNHTMPIRLPSERSMTRSPVEPRDLIDFSRHPSSHNPQQQQHSSSEEKSALDHVRRSPTRLRGHTDQQLPHHEPVSNALRRAKTTADKAGAFHSFHNPPPTESRSPVLTRPTNLLHPIDTKVDTAASQHASPSDTCSPSLAPLPRKKILIKLAIIHQARSIMVEIGPLTSVKDLLAQAHQTGALSEGSWGVFEVWTELGIERPIREIETIMSVVDTWTSADTNETHLLVQKNDLSGLAVSKRSFTSGRHGGNLWCELKPGKWTKKYVLLRDNELYLCSNDKGKDEMFLCTMEKFDVYAIPSWAHKTLKGVPREYAFGLKSLNKLSFFETKSDFIHKFSCKDRLVLLEWIRRLYDARVRLSSFLYTCYRSC
ncbi:hypothetical protein PtB15_9B388 [Puccinia triticina]|nr:hypothetical protein PtB15_9B388 [Puccinia triticina]